MPRIFLQKTVGKKDDYKKFSEQFGKCLKPGIYEDSTDRAKIAELLRLNTSKSGDEQIGLKEYVDRMKEWQNDSLLHHWRECRSRVLFSVLEKFAQEGS